jgi:diguanylate cyclase (GGDEF)-like protein
VTSDTSGCDAAAPTSLVLLTGVLSAVVALLVRLGSTGLHHEPSAGLLLAAAVVHAAAIVALGAAGAPPVGVAWPVELLAMLNLTAQGAQGRAASFVVLFMDLDGFKAINDTFGHQAGDRVLVEVSVRVREALRDDDTLVRIAGDEFVAVCSGPLDEATARALAGRVPTRIVEPIDVNGLDVTVSASIGIALSPPSTGDATRDALGILRLADHAMYDAKRAGGSRTVVVEAADV